MPSSSYSGRSTRRQYWSLRRRATPDATGNVVVLSRTRLKVRNVDPVSNTIEVEAGVTLQHVQDSARDADRLFPLSLAAQGSCTI